MLIEEGEIVNISAVGASFVYMVLLSPNKLMGYVYLVDPYDTLKV